MIIQLLCRLGKDTVFKKGMFGTFIGLMGGIYTESVIKIIGAFIGVVSGSLGLFLIVLSIVQKRREMSAWEEDQRDKRRKEKDN